ncbi:MAG: amino acid adenylation protein [Candidatus Acidoferrum typicum]|nr:amino acid adenylation protein [Candidatus Acidoferrum typicum]
MSRIDSPTLLDGVAIIGMAGRFPGARTVAEFWRNQLEGVEAISHFTVEELEVPGGRELSERPTYVRARSILDDVDLFDAEFFGIYPREAELMDPQHRLFLECCWEALEDAAYDPFTYPGSIGVHAGCSMPSYFLSRLCASDDFIQKFTGGYQVGNYLEMLGNSLDFLSTRVSYKLNLRGPSFTLQAGCSTSLVAVCQAFQSLMTYQSDMALAGGSSITLPQKRGTEYQEGGMTSPDGHCRAFDASASGTVFGSGVGVVLLKRIEDALRDGDQIYAVIRGCALNNDGSSKVGFTAPSVEGQSRVITMALEGAGVSPESIGYIEAHGTGTPLGDPIELAALTQAFRANTAERQFCAIGTAKTNVGHLDVAAGVTGLINATNILRHGILPPTLHFQRPNPKFDLGNSPFYVNAKRTEWKPQEYPRRAGVSAFGVGGTNAHVILEEAPAQTSEDSDRPTQLLVLSARSEQALENATDNLAEHLIANRALSLADLAWTLQVGRRKFPHRRWAAVSSVSDAIEVLSQRDRKRLQTRRNANDGDTVYFLFPGQGSQHSNMGRQIYESEPVFRQSVDHCCEILRSHIGEDLLPLLYPSPDASDSEKLRLTDTALAQPAIFTIEYALAQLWMSWGIQPQGMLGHSVGEFVAACLAGVFSLEDALALIAARGHMMQKLAPGGMLSVRLPESEIRARLNGHLAIAAVNAPSLCVVAGPFDALDSLETELKNEGVPTRRLVTSHAFHSSMMDPILDQFSSRVAQTRLSAPKLPFVSSVSGTWISENEATGHTYWARHLRAPVQFSAGVQELLKRSEAVLLEVGPGNVLSTLARQNLPRQNGNAGGDAQNSVTIVSSLGDASSSESSSLHLLNAVGSLWAAGLQPKWEALHSGERRRRVSLPTYPFERKRFWLEAPAAQKPMLSPVNPVPVTETVRTNMPFEETQSVTHNSQNPTPHPQQAADRAAIISSMVSEIFADLSGVRIQPSDASSSFLEMGFDSLFLTQVSQSLHSKFGLKVTFRQLLSDLPSIKSLTEFIDSQLPPEVLAPKAPERREVQPEPAGNFTAVPDTQLRAQSSAPANGNLSTTETPVERLMREQLQTMNQLFAKQLDVLRGLSPETAAAKTQNELPQATPTSVGQVAAAPAPPAPAAQESREFKPFGPYKPPQKGTSAQLTDVQQKHIRELIARCTKRTAKSKSMTQQYRRRLADPRVVSGFRAQWKEMVYPILTVRSKGSRIWDVDGNEYIDILNGFGPIMLGHRPDFVERAIEQQLHEGFEIGPQTPLAGEVAEMFCEMTGNERMTFCNTGSEAVIAALRVARTVTGRSKVVLFAGSYHGMFDEVLVRGVKGSDTPRSLPIAPGIPRESVGNMVVLDYGTSESLEWIRSHASELAAVLVEPVQSRHPNLQPREFLRGIRKITQDSGAALIFDEVVTGFRVHPGGCQALFDIRADLATYGKVLAGGMPIGVLAGKSQFMDALDGGTWQFGDDSYPSVGVTFFAGTFHRHPLTLSAVKAVLEHFRQHGPQLQLQLSAKTASLVSALNALFEKGGVPSRIENFASIFCFSFPTDFPLGSLLHYHLRAKGIYVLEGFPCFLTTAHSDADIAAIIRAFDESIAEMQAGGILQGRSELTAQKIENRSSTAPAISQPVPESAPSIEVPMTEAQMEIWLSAQLSDDASCAFNESFTLLMRGQLDTQALRESLQDLVNRHEALRARVIPERNSLHISSGRQLSLTFEDLSSASASERTAALENAKQQEASTPFDLINGPVLRLRLFRLEAQLHALVVTSHHVVCDGWSTNVLLDELSALYAARRAATNPALPPALQLSEYARQQSESALDEEVAAYWRKRFEQLPPVLELPTDRPRPAVKSFKGATYRARIDAAIYKQVRQAGAKQGCTLFATLLTGFASLLHRLTAQNDIVIGIPTAGQSLLDNGSLVGHCVNFLPIRVQLIDGLSAAELFQQVKRTVLDAYDHQSYTYGTLVRNLKLRRDPSRLPLIEVQFNLEKVGTNLNFPGLQVEVDPNPKSAVNFDLFVNIVESDQGLLIDCDYNSDLFDRDTIARWLTHFETLLKGLAADGSQEIDRLPILSEAELRNILQDWNATKGEYPRDKCVHELIEEQAARNPNAVAVSSEGNSLTYSELDKRANQLARHLIKIGVTPGSLVGIALDRSLDLLVGLLGIWKAGAAYLPLDAAYPRDRIAFIMEETSLATLVTHSKLVPNLPLFDTRPICLDRDWVLIERERETCPAINLDPSSVAYTIYTSGSTGKPKGVEVTHRNVANLLWSMRETPGLHDRDRLVAVTTLSFDIAALELFLPLISGAHLILASRETAQDPRLLIELLDESKATAMQATPATWRLLLEVGWTGLPGLKMLCGGEALPRQLANELLQRGELWNMYGPTETTIWSATSRVEAGEGPVTIGPPIHNTNFYVLDTKLQPVPIGIPGELHIGGDGVAKGYFRNAPLTSERFIADTFSKKAGDRLYKTGDLVRYRPDGRLEFLGRLDNQVKVRGFRIELGEIESVLARNPNIRECVVAAQEDDPGSNRLVAYCVPQESQKCSSEDLRNWVAASLPEYMIPSIFVFMPALPHTPNGKVDRKALVRLDALNLPEQNLFIAPRNPAEAKLASVCAEVLHLDRVSVHDSLFDLGSDSIHLFQIIARAAQVGITLAPQQILRLRTVAALAAESGANASENGGPKRKLERIARVSREQYQLDAAPQAT